MGLRINTNIAALVALRQLSVINGDVIRNFERLSTGLKLNRARDGPFDFTLSRRIDAQLDSLGRVSENVQTNSGVFNAVDQALGQLTELVRKVRGSAIGVQNVANAEQIAAEQDAVNSIISQIDRLAATTRFNGIDLLNGNFGFLVSGVPTQGILDVRPLTVKFNPVSGTTSFSITVNQIATRATALAGSSMSLGSLAVSGGSVTLRVLGPLGTVDIAVANGTTAGQLATTINFYRGFTGVYASGAFMLTETFGRDALLRLEQVAGPGVFRGGNPAAPGFAGTGSVFFTRGTNAVATFQGQTLSGVGNLLAIHNPAFTGEIFLNPPGNQTPGIGSGATGTFAFSIRTSGFLAQVGTESDDQIRVGIPNLSSPFLGTRPFVLGGTTFGGFASTILTGGGNSFFANAGGAMSVADAALSVIDGLRGKYGAISADAFDAIRDFNDVHSNELKQANSTLKDADLAEESARLARNQVLFQSGIAVLGQANQISQLVLELLR